MLAGNQLPDHVTIARFRARHEQALAGFLVASLELCAGAGLVRLGVVALDGTKVAGNAADKANRTLAKLDEEVAEILRQAADADKAEDRKHGPAQGDELPAELASPGSRLARLRQAKVRLEAEAAERQRRYQQRVAEHAAETRACGKPPSVPLKPRPRDEAPNPNAAANTTDPDSRFLRTRNGTVQGYNAQAVVTEQQIIVVKSNVHYRAAFEPIASEIIEVDTPGLSSPRLERLEFHRIQRPIYPFDKDMTWSPSPVSS